MSGQSLSERRSVPLGCPVCHQRVIRGLGEKQGHLLWVCSACHLIFAHPDLLDREAVQARYQGHHENAPFVTPPTALASLERLVRSAEPYRHTGRWLDFGYGEGGLLEVAERHRWRCYGVEISARALEYGRRHGWSVASEPRRDPRFISGGFDVVTLVELLEHVPAPLGVLQDAVSWLRPGGLLYLTTPNARSLNRMVLGIEWSVVCPPEHLMLWTARALRIALAAVGFRILWIRAEGWNPSELPGRLRWFGASSRPVNRQQAGLALSEAFSRSQTRRAAKTAANRVLSMLGIGDTLKVWAVRGR